MLKGDFIKEKIYSFPDCYDLWKRIVEMYFDYFCLVGSSTSILCPGTLDHTNAEDLPLTTLPNFTPGLCRGTMPPGARTCHVSSTQDSKQIALTSFCRHGSNSLGKSYPIKLNPIKSAIVPLQKELIKSRVKYFSRLIMNILSLSPVSLLFSQATLKQI